MFCRTGGRDGEGVWGHQALDDALAEAPGGFDDRGSGVAEHYARNVRVDVPLNDDRDGDGGVVIVGRRILDDLTGDGPSRGSLGRLWISLAVFAGSVIVLQVSLAVGDCSVRPEGGPAGSYSIGDGCHAVDPEVGVVLAGG